MTLALAVTALTASAIPAKPGQVRMLTLSDGTTVKARLVGDEHGHYWLAENGRAYQKVENMAYFSEVSVETVKAKAQARRSQANARRAKRLAPRRVGEFGSYTGKKKGIIILVNFSDVTFKSANNNALYKRIANEENFSYGDFKGSMYDYFKAQSEGQFELSFDVVGPVTVSKTQAYYGGNDSDGNDKYPATMVLEALKLVDSQVNFADYDWDGDGEVDQVYVVYAGQGEADGGSDDTIWPHEWELSSAASYGDGAGAQTYDGVKIDTYACGGELNGSSKICGIGTMCHEFSHCLGYPDFYDTDYSGGQGMFEWDLMDSGSYNGDGYQPAGYTSYERWVAGWKKPIELTATTSVTGMKALQDGGETYVVYNQGNRNEYFLLENRQQTGWDAGIPGEGLLILHVDYDASVWASNQPNDAPSHQRMTWIPADNKYQYETYSGSKYYTTSGAKNDPFPYGSVNAFSKSTTPAAKFYNKNTDGTYYLDSSIEQITQNADGTVSFNFKAASTVATPTFSPKAGRYAEAQTVTISCTTEGATIYYTTDGSDPTVSSTLYTQPITIEETTTLKAIAITADDESAVTSAKYIIGSSLLYESASGYSKANTGTSEIATTDEKLDYSGWSEFTKIYFGGTDEAYENGGCLKLGTSKVNGCMKASNIALTGQGTLSFYMKQFKDSEAASITVSVSGATADVTTFNATSSWQKYVVALSDATGDITISFNATKRVYIDEIELTAGSVQPGTKLDVTMTFSESTVTATLGQTFTEPTLTTTPSDLVVSYTSSNTSVATVDASTGKVTLVAAGTTTITAAFAGNDSYNPAEASYTLMVREQGGNKYEATFNFPENNYGMTILSGNTTEYNPDSISISSDNVMLKMEGEKSSRYWKTTDDSFELRVYKSCTMTISAPEKGKITKIEFAGSAISDVCYGKSLLVDGTWTGEEPSVVFTFNKTQKIRTIKVAYQVEGDSPATLAGDVNKDGVVTIADVTALVNILLGKDDAEPYQYDHEAADVNGDGNISIADVTALVNYLLGK